MEKTLEYLTQLELHNERSWYHAHKAEKAQADAEFAALVQELIFRCGQQDADLLFRRPEELIYRIPRDVRVWPNKPPYNPAYRAHISSGGKHGIPAGCYVSIQPGDRSCVCGGLYSPSFREATLMVREQIYYHAGRWEAIVNEPVFAAHFQVLGEKLKNVPREYPPDAPCGEYLKHKSWYIVHPLTDREVLSADLGERIAGLAQIMQPFNAFINEALADFRYPEENRT